jgi:hypothetical protein
VVAPRVQPLLERDRPHAPRRAPAYRPT